MSARGWHGFLAVVAPRDAALVLLLAWAWPACAGRAPVSRQLHADLDRDGRPEKVVFNPARDPALSVWRGGKRLHSWLSARWKPWRVEVADVEGDGRLEILVGVRKSTRFVPRPHPCLFVYGWNGRQAFPKWLGSSLGAPFDDFRVCDTDGDGADEVVVRAGTPSRRWVVVYTWRGFGFTAGRELGPWKTASLLKTKDGRVGVVTPGGKVWVGTGAGGAEEVKE